MQVLGGLLSLGAVGLGCACLLCGLANTLDWCAWEIHRFARSLRELHTRRSAEMRDKWAGEIER